MWARLALVSALVIACGAVHAEEDMDEILGGFDDEDEDLEVISDMATQAADARRWELTGSLTLGASYAYAHDPPEPGEPDYRDLTRLQAQLALELDIDLPRDWELRIAGRGFRDYFYALEGRSDFPDEVLDNHQREAEFQELWLRGELAPDLDLQFGRQIVSWGRSDNLRVVDVLNPIDSREPGLVNVEDLKLPVTMTRLDYYWGSWSLTGVAIHETRFDTSPVPGSDFFPRTEGGPNGAFDLPEQTPGNGGANTEWAVRLRGIFSGWDISLHWARYYDDRPHVVGSFQSIAPFGMPTTVFLPDRLEHARLTLWGASGQIARGDWLFKSELAYVRGLRFYEGDLRALTPGRSRKRSRVDAMLGLEYLGINDVTIALELVNRHLGGFDSRLELAPNYTRRNAVEGSLVVTADFWNDRIHTALVAVVFGAHAQDGAILRGEVEYELRDALALTTGVVLYEEGDDPPFSSYGHLDRIFLKLQYSF
jgi:hypothetical protein